MYSIIFVPLRTDLRGPPFAHASGHQLALGEELRCDHRKDHDDGNNDDGPVDVLRIEGSQESFHSGAPKISALSKLADVLNRESTNGLVVLAGVGRIVQYAEQCEEERHLNQQRQA